LQSIYSVNAKQ